MAKNVGERVKMRGGREEESGNGGGRFSKFTY
jgi:hypothetical protein